MVVWDKKEEVVYQTEKDCRVQWTPWVFEELERRNPQRQTTLETRCWREYRRSREVLPERVDHGPPLCVSVDIGSLARCLVEINFCREGGRRKIRPCLWPRRRVPRPPTLSFRGLLYER